MSSTSLTATAHAKINLGLEILNKRSDGYHEISTVFCPITLSDDIRFEPDDHTIGMTSEGIHIPLDETNLCIRAAQHLRAKAGATVGVQMSMLKQIPVGAGLGGGSSNAACVLRSLNTMWNLDLPDDDLASLGMELGADVPYFLSGGMCHASGIGEKLESLEPRFPYWIVTVVPPVHVATGWAYEQITPRNTSSSSLKDDFAASIDDLEALSTILRNDFEDVVLPAFPEIRKTRGMLEDTGLSCVRMSGSGSAVFGLSKDEDTARQAAGRFDPPFVVSLTPPLLP